MTSCSNDEPMTSVFYDEISGDGVIIGFLVVGCLLAVACLIIFLEEVVFIRKHYKHHDTRGWKILVLLGLYPAVCITSLIGILVPTSVTLLELMSSWFCYFSYLSVCVYLFINMTIECFGGDDEMIQTLADDKVGLNTPPCCCCCCCILRPITLTRKSLRVIELLSMQVIFFRPVLLFIAAILWTDGQYVEEINASEPYIYIAVLSGISTVLSMYGMIVIYHASKKHLTHYHLALKFIPLKIVILCVNLQRTIFNVLADKFDIPGCKGTRGSRVRATNINNGLLVIETFLCCLLARKGYRTRSPNTDEVVENVPATVEGTGKDTVNPSTAEFKTQISVTSDTAPIFQNDRITNEYSSYNSTGLGTS